MDMSIEEAIFMLESLDNKIEIALADQVANEAKQQIEFEVLYNVYDYPASDIFMQSRRGASGGIADPSNIDADAFGTTLTLTDKADLQNLWGAGSQGTWSADVATLVQNGSAAFHQPYPRPFLDDAIERAINEGRIDKALKEGLEAQGIILD